MRLLNIIIEFLPLIGFLLIESLWGVHKAILGLVIITLMTLVGFHVFNRKITRIFMFSAVLSIVMGSIDFFLGTSEIIKYEAVFTSLVTGVFFGLTLAKNQVPMLQELALKQGTLTEDQLNPKMRRYLWLMTAVWTGYFVTKATAYVFLAIFFTFKEGVYIRMIAGSLSFYILFLITIFGGRHLFGLFDRMNMLEPAS
jgi:uncharacterized membrane protein